MKTPDTISQKPIEILLQETITLINAFKRLVEEETAALDKGDFAHVDTLQNHKRKLAKAYQNQVEDLHTRAKEVQNASEIMRAQLVEARTAFTLTLAENMRALERMKNSCGRLVERILDAARRALQQKLPDAPQAYGATGRRVFSNKKTLSMGLNEQL